jgi:mono/diheme cytochrome c family protein
MSTKREIMRPVVMATKRGIRRAAVMAADVEQAGPAAIARPLGWACLAAVFALLALAGCSDDGSAPNAPNDPDPVAVSFAADIQPIFDGNCLGCHGAATSGGLDLRAAATPGSLVNAAATGYPGSRVVPGSPLTSVLYLKVQGDASTGDRMPLGGAALSAAQRALIRDWIEQGALDN